MQKSTIRKEMEIKKTDLQAAVLANWTMEPQTYRLDFGDGKTVS